MFATFQMILSFLAVVMLIIDLAIKKRWLLLTIVVLLFGFLGLQFVKMYF